MSNFTFLDALAGVIRSKSGYMPQRMRADWDINRDRLYVEFQLIDGEPFYRLVLRAAGGAGLIAEAEQQLEKIMSHREWG